MQYFREDAAQAKKSYEDKFGAKGAKGAKTAGAGSKKATPGAETYLDEPAVANAGSGTGDRIVADAGADAKEGSNDDSRRTAKVNIYIYDYVYGYYYLRKYLYIKYLYLCTL